MVFSLLCTTQKMWLEMQSEYVTRCHVLTVTVRSQTNRIYSWNVLCLSSEWLYVNRAQRDQKSKNHGLEPRRPKLDAMCRQLLTKFCVLGWARYGASLNGVLVIMHHTEDVVGDAIRICDTMPCADSHCAIADKQNILVECTLLVVRMAIRKSCTKGSWIQESWLRYDSVTLLQEAMHVSAQSFEVK